MDPKISQSWEAFLNPEVARPNLIAASIYIAGFEALKASIVDRIRCFFWTGRDQSGDKIDPKYRSDVLARNTSPVHASLDWLKERGVIDDRDLATFDRVKNCRNTLAHKLLSVLSSEGLPPELAQCFIDMVGLLRKIEVWWIVNVDIATDPDYDGAEIDEGGIIPGPVLCMQILVDVALGDAETARRYHDEFRRQAGVDNASGDDERPPRSPTEGRPLPPSGGPLAPRTGTAPPLP